MYECSCIQNLYEFDIRPKGCGIMLYQDLSRWQTGPRYSKPSTYEVEITVPNRRSPVKLTLSVDNINQILPEDLSSSTPCLPDGIYQFVTVSCKKRYVRYRAFLCALECRMNCLKQQNTDRDLLNDDWARIHEIQLFIDSAKYNAEKDNPIKANKHYYMAKELLDLLECDCKCC